MNRLFTLSITALLILTTGAFAQKSPVKKAGVAKPKTPMVTTGATDGKTVYLQNCLTCHQADGGGVPNMNPPLIKTDYVLGDKTRLIKIVLNGFNDRVEIEGEMYNNVMPSLNHLTDKQIADVLTYVRSNFGNKASAVSATEVKKLRGK
ncbi:cytochrome c [Mucilaginibacter sp. CSA2-8R]|uniref:c-type cytochrome n=1 Tax=Mucilaginibacter sp. CSA2-8R TaxID=3141542 RepID=UPI00315C9642